AAVHAGGVRPFPGGGRAGGVARGGVPGPEERGGLHTRPADGRAPALRAAVRGGRAGGRGGGRRRRGGPPGHGGRHHGPQSRLVRDPARGAAAAAGAGGDRRRSGRSGRRGVARFRPRLDGLGRAVQRRSAAGGGGGGGRADGGRSGAGQRRPRRDGQRG